MPLWLENLSNYPNYRPFHYIATKAEEFVSILSEINVSIFFDFGHANVNAEIPVPEFFSKFHSHIVGVSMSNNDGKLDQHLKLDDGTINYKEIVKIMKELKWHGVIGFETRNIMPKASIENLRLISQSH